VSEPPIQEGPSKPGRGEVQVEARVAAQPRLDRRGLVGAVVVAHQVDVEFRGDGPGIGPVTAAQAIVAFSHPGRCRNDAAFASLSGTCPIPASSGHTVRHRLNRGGDTIATVRMRDCPATQAYIARRTAEGKTIREIKRCLKRYIARQLYRTLTATMTPTTNILATA
jgi:transposase